MNVVQTLAHKFAQIKNPFIIGGGSTVGVEVAEVIPQEAIKLTLQVVIAVATLVKFFKERRQAKKDAANGN